MWIIILAVVILLLFLTARLFKIPKIGCLSMNTGGVKTGKSLMSVWFAFRLYSRALVKYYIKWFWAFIRRKPKPEKPLLYSNIPLGVPYVPLTIDLLLRKTRFRYGSVIYCCEASLVADSMYFRNLDDNERLLLFNKLIGHETKGGALVYDTQCIQDVHFSVKRSISNYFFIHRAVKWIPFVYLAYVKEYTYSEDNNRVNVETEDIESSYKIVVIPKRMYRMYDCYAYSSMTDDLPVEDNIVEPVIIGRRFGKFGKYIYNLKTKEIVSFKKFIREKRYLDNAKKDS